MSLIRRAVQARERRAADPRLPWGPPTDPPPPGYGFGSEAQAMQIMAVYGSVRVIAAGLSSLPWGVLSSPDPAKRKVLPQTPLLTKPYEEISRNDWIKQYVWSMALRGNFFGQIVSRDQDGYPTQIKPIHPDHARVRRLPSGLLEYRFNGQIVQLDDVFHLRYLSAPESLEGINPIAYLRITFELARKQELYGAAYFDNSANPAGTIEVEDDLDDDETLALARRWMAAHQGVGRAHLPAVLTGGAKFNPISINPKDSQFLESRQWSAGAISGVIFGIPPHMLGIVDRTTSWGSGIEVQERGFVTNTLGDYLNPLEEAMTGLHPGPQYVRFNLSERLRGDTLTRYQGYNLAIGSGWLCADDVRGKEDMPPVPNGEGKVFMVPINSEPVEAALESIEASKKAAEAQQQPPPENPPPGADGGTNGR